MVVSGVFFLSCFLRQSRQVPVARCVLGPVCRYLRRLFFEKTVCQRELHASIFKATASTGTVMKIQVSIIREFISITWAVELAVGMLRPWRVRVRVGVFGANGLVSVTVMMEAGRARKRV